MQATKFKFSKTPITSITRPTQLGEKILDGGKSLLGLAIAATASAIFTAIFRDAMNANCKDVREHSKQAFQYVVNECKSRD
jgi:hypothetical protein